MGKNWIEQFLSVSCCTFQLFWSHNFLLGGWGEISDRCNWQEPLNGRFLILNQNSLFLNCNFLKGWDITEALISIKNSFHYPLDSFRQKIRIHTWSKLLHQFNIRQLDRSWFEMIATDWIRRLYILFHISFTNVHPW